MSENKFRLVMKGAVVGYAKSIDIGDRFCGDLVWMTSIGGKAWRPETIKHDEEDRFAGITDKNGVEVYERDRVNIGGKEMTIYWSDGRMEWEAMTSDVAVFRLYMLKEKNLEVIGRAGKEAKR